MPLRILAINSTLPGLSDAQVGYDDRTSLLDYDVAVFVPSALIPRTDRGGVQNEAMLRDETAHALNSDIAHWRTQINSALQHGRTVVVFVGQQEFFWSDETNTRKRRSNYDFLPHKLELTTAHGATIQSSGHNQFTSYWRDLQSRTVYRAYIESAVRVPLFSTRSGAKNVGGLWTFEGLKGHLILLPDLDWQNLKERPYGWAQAASIVGKQLAHHLREIHKGLTKVSEKSALPAWAAQAAYVSNAESKALKELEALKAQMEALSGKRSDLEAALAREAMLRDLLFEQGKPLEDAITAALQLMGYKVENFRQGDVEIDHLIVSPETDRYLGEAEGKETSAITVVKLRQLITNLMKDPELEKGNPPAVGILFGNGFRLVEPAQRQDSFTPTCMHLAKQNSIVFVSTVDLFMAAKHLRDKPDAAYAAACRKAIKDGKGGIVKFPPAPT